MGRPSQFQTGLGAALGGIGEAIGRHREENRQVAAAKALQDALNAREESKLNTESIDPNTPLGRKYFEAMTGLKVEDKDLVPGQRFKMADLAKNYNSSQMLKGKEYGVDHAKPRAGGVKDDTEFNELLKGVTMGIGNAAKAYHLGSQSGLYAPTGSNIMGQLGRRMIGEVPAMSPSSATYQQMVMDASPALAGLWASGKGQRVTQPLIEQAREAMAKSGAPADQALNATNNLLNEGKLRVGGYFARDMEPTVRAHRNQLMTRALASTGVDPNTWQIMDRKTASSVNSDYKKNPQAFASDPDHAAYLQGARIAAPDMDWSTGAPAAGGQ